MYTRTNTYNNEVIFYSNAKEKEVCASKKHKDYLTFGMPMPGRQFNAGNYRFGFNGKEMDNEVSGTGNQYDYGFRIYNPRIAKFLSVDPLTASYPWYTPYQFAGNKPIWAIDLDGKEEYYTSSGQLIGKYGTSTEIRVVYDEFVAAAKDIISQGSCTPSGDAMNNVLYNKGSAGAFSMPDEAAKDWGTRNNEKSIVENKEYSSFIFLTKINGKRIFSYTMPKKGEEASATNTFTIKNGTKLFGHIHSHGGFMEKYDNNNFSGGEEGKPEGDIDMYNKLGITGYLTTPNGSFQKYTPDVGSETLGCDMPSDCKDPTTDNLVVPINNSAPVLVDQPK